jgi:hypothetical protein
MNVEGSCHCGHVTFAAEIDPATAGICHCTDCQTLTGSAFRITVRSRPGTFQLRSGTPTLYVKTAESGNQREHAFCPRCGTPIYATSPGGGTKTHSLRPSTFRQRTEVTPVRQIWTRSRVGWLDRLDTLTASEKQG